MEAYYKKLGLTGADVEKLNKYNLTYLLDKIKASRELYEQQKAELEITLQRMENNLNAAREAQLNLLPTELNGVPEIGFCARFYPSQYVSGDIYNVFRLDENHVGCYHIDISGHGVAAALFSISLSHLLTTSVTSRSVLKVRDENPPYYRINMPDEVMRILDEDKYYEQFGIFFTMIYLIINIQTGKIQFCRAGHNPPLIIRSNGKVDIYQEGGLPIGLAFPRHDLIGEIELKKGDILYLYSDGIIEAENKSGQPFSRDRMINLLRHNRQQPLSENMDRLFTKLQTYCGHRDFEDDVSMIGLEYQSG